MPNYPYTTEDGTTRWACCESTIGPTCEHRTLPKVVIEFADAICADCVNIIANADPDNMGRTPEQCDEWLDKFDAYCDGENFTIVPADYNDPETGPYFTHSGCPICSDGLGNDVYPVMVIGF